MPLESYGCSICGKQAPKDLRRHGQYADRMKWLRKHYQRSHPTLFRKWAIRESVKERR